MKKLLKSISLFAFIVFISIDLISQEYHSISFVENNIESTSLKEDTFKGYLSFVNGSREHKMVYCIIDGAGVVTYLKIGYEIINGVEYVRFDPDDIMFPPPYTLYVREDTTYGRLWVLDVDKDEEWLIADLSIDRKSTRLNSSHT